ncbi:hypothetical protein [Bacillus sp. AFS029637]|uniref:hypothetical protein n=1 Tax=Bacillus sp. AFS029637 TaxID=2033495 RepID=UPI000BFBF477|nr:hypothetical protein [Bacillus sp. AFS029637]PGZ74666.1 hypothetical protein COE49_08300 [Bacillus sp. AFS029637]
MIKVTQSSIEKARIEYKVLRETRHTKAILFRLYEDAGDKIDRLSIIRTYPSEAFAVAEKNAPHLFEQGGFINYFI